MELNLRACITPPTVGSPRAVVWQVDGEDALNPLSLCVAYEEESVRPVVSDFDAFLVGAPRHGRVTAV